MAQTSVCADPLQMKILLSICLCSLLTGMQNQSFYRRNLPHWFPRGATIFVTWRLFDSLRPSSIQQLKEVRTRLQNQPTPANTDPTDWELRKRKKIFAVLDSMLDHFETGPMWLKRPEIADLIQHTLLTKYASLYTLWSYAIMSTIVMPCCDPSSSTTLNQFLLKQL